MASDSVYIDIDCKGLKSSPDKKMKESKNKKNFVCSHCQKIFTHKGNWVQHVRSHTKERPFSCNLCGMAYTKSSHLLQHRRSHKSISNKNDNISNQLYNCYICGRTFNLFNSLKVHMRSHSDECTISCSMCDKKFRHKSTLERHLKVHSGIKPYSCDLCQKRFYDSSDLRKHIKVHTGSTKGKIKSVEIANSVKKHVDETNDKMNENVDTKQRLESVDELENKGDVDNKFDDTLHDVKDKDSILSERHVLDFNPNRFKQHESNIEFVTDSPHEILHDEPMVNNGTEVASTYDRSLNLEQEGKDDNDMQANNNARELDKTFLNGTGIQVISCLKKAISVEDSVKNHYHEHSLEIEDEIQQVKAIGNNAQQNVFRKPTSCQREINDIISSQKNKCVQTEASAPTKACDDPEESVDNLQKNKGLSSVLNELTIKQTNLENQLLRKYCLKEKKESADYFMDQLNIDEIETFTKGINCEVQLEIKVVHAIASDLSGDFKDIVEDDLTVQNSKDTTCESKNSHVSLKYKSMSTKELAYLRKAYWESNKNKTIAQLNNKLFKIHRKLRKKGSSDTYCISKYYVIGPKIWKCNNEDKSKEAMRKDKMYMYLGTALNIPPRKHSTFVSDTDSENNRTDIFKVPGDDVSQDCDQHVSEDINDKQSETVKISDNRTIVEDKELNQIGRLLHVKTPKLLSDITTTEGNLLTSFDTLPSSIGNSKLQPDIKKVEETTMISLDTFPSSIEPEITLVEETLLKPPDALTFSSENTQLLPKITTVEETLTDATPPEEAPELSDDKLFYLSRNAEVFSRSDHNLEEPSVNLITVKMGKSNSKVYTCHNCKKQFDNFFDHRKHLQKHLRDKKFTCEDCNHIFDRWRDFTHHKCGEENQSKNEYICAYCDKVFHNEALLKKHMAQKKLTCRFCKKIACLISQLKKHERNHFQFECSKCLKRFETHSNLIDHWKVKRSCASRKRRKSSVECKHENKEIKKMNRKESEEKHFDTDEIADVIPYNMEGSGRVSNNSDNKMPKILQKRELVIPSLSENHTETVVKNTNNITDVVKQSSSSRAEWQMSTDYEQDPAADKRELTKDAANQFVGIDTAKELRKERSKALEDELEIVNDRKFNALVNEKQYDYVTKGHDLVSDKVKRKSKSSKSFGKKFKMNPYRFIVSNTLFSKKNETRKQVDQNVKHNLTSKKTLIDKLEKNKYINVNHGSVNTYMKEKAVKLDEDTNSPELRKDTSENAETNQVPDPIGCMKSVDVKMKGAINCDVVGKDLDPGVDSGGSDTVSDNDSEGYISVSGDNRDETEMISDDDSDGYEECSMEEVQAMLCGHNKQGCA